MKSPIRSPYLANISILLSRPVPKSIESSSPLSSTFHKSIARASYLAIIGPFGFKQEQLLDQGFCSDFRQNFSVTLPSVAYDHLLWRMHHPCPNPDLPWMASLSIILFNLSFITSKVFWEYLTTILFDFTMPFNAIFNSCRCSLCGNLMERAHLWLSCPIALDFFCGMQMLDLIPSHFSFHHVLLTMLMTRLEVLLASRVAVAIYRGYMTKKVSPDLAPRPTLYHFFQMQYYEDPLPRLGLGK
jgi:hypothetical protein